MKVDPNWHGYVTTSSSNVPIVFDHTERRRALNVPLGTVAEWAIFLVLLVYVIHVW